MQVNELYSWMIVCFFAYVSKRFDVKLKDIENNGTEMIAWTLVVIVDSFESLNKFGSNMI